VVVGSITKSVLKACCSLGVGFLAVITATQVDAAATARQERERLEVRAIFSMLLSSMVPGDGWPCCDLPCVVPEEWRDFWPDDGRAPRPIRPRALLTPRQALDPKGEQPQMFCDLAERNAQAKEVAKGLRGDDFAGVTTGDMSFSYPIFNRGLTRATLDHEGANTHWFKSGKTDFVSSWRVIRLKKAKGVWTAEFVTLGIAN
jgi:hypothetical protein